MPSSSQRRAHRSQGQQGRPRARDAARGRARDGGICGSDDSAAGPGSGADAYRGRKQGRRRADGVSHPIARTDLYEEVTRRIIAQLEAGTFPWVQPWRAPACGGAAPGLPRNAVTGRPYSGINVLILWGEVIERAYPSQAWLTFRQALDAGGCVRKGEKGVTVVYADRFTPEAEKARARDTGDEARSIPFLKRFTLFNVAQCEGLGEGRGEGPGTGRRAKFAADPVPLPEREIVPVAEALIAASGADVRIGGAKAFYAPAADFIQLPPQPAFADQINYYRTALHELTHWAGGPKRLARDQSGGFGSATYAREELVAEMGSAFLCAALGIVPTVRHADYLANWLAVLRDDLSDDPAVRGSGGPRGRAIFRAASAASKAADYLLGLRGSAPGGDAPRSVEPPVARAPGLHLPFPPLPETPRSDEHGGEG